MIQINKVHHIAIISSNYDVSKKFYTQVLGFKIVQEIYRKERDSFKLDLSLNGQYLIELFSFPSPPKRVSRPESTGLRHLAFEVDDVQGSIAILAKQGVIAEPVRVDEMTKKKFTFIADPDDLPIELYER